MNQIKPIETVYKGYRFRSRTEARWAVFFDSIGLKWEYEFQGYRLPSGWYLPDFFFPTTGDYAEVKAVKFSVREIALCRELAESTGSGVLLLDGTPEIRAYYMIRNWYGESDEDSYEMIGIDFSMSAARRFPKSWWQCFEDGDHESPAIYDPDSVFCSEMKKAVDAARSARFEHGESPR